MNWLKDFVKPKLDSLVQRKEAPSNIWTKCGCGERMLYLKDLKENLNVCSYCDQHMYIDYKERLAQLFDKNQFKEIDIEYVNSDPLKFKDLKKYTERIKEAEKKTSQKDAAIVAEGSINQINCTVFILDFSFMGGSMGQFVGEAFRKACENSVEKNQPLISLSSSGGARMQEGIVSLMQLPKTVAALNLLNNKKIPFISILTHPTTGGVSASYAMLGDIIIAEKGSMIGFAGKRVIEETIKEKLPDDFQTAEYLLEHGMIDIVVHRKDLKKTLSRVLSKIIH